MNLRRKLRLRLTIFWRRLKGTCVVCDGKIQYIDFGDALCRPCFKTIMHGRNYGMSDHKILELVK